MKKAVSILMAVIMAMFSFTATAFAAEKPAADAATAVVTVDEDVPEGAEVLEVIDFDVTPDMVDENGMIAIPASVTSTTLVDQSWTFTNYHQGSNRSYAYSTIGFSVRITDSNGSSVSDKISIELHDTVGGSVQYFTAYGNGAWYGNSNISIVANRQYFFYYDNVSSSTRTMSIHMVIYH